MARDFKPKRDGPRDDLFAAMPPLEANKALFAFRAGVREKRRAQGHDEVKLMFVDVKKAHLKAKCEEEENGSSCQTSSKKLGGTPNRRDGCTGCESGVGMGGRLREKTCGGRVWTRQSSVNDILPSQDAGASRRAWRRLHGQKLDVEQKKLWRTRAATNIVKALLESSGLNKESKAVNNAAMKPEEINQEEDAEMLDASETKRFRSLAATLNDMTSDRSDVCTKMADPTRSN